MDYVTGSAIDVYYLGKPDISVGQLCFDKRNRYLQEGKKWAVQDYQFGHTQPVAFNLYEDLPSAEASLSSCLRKWEHMDASQKLAAFSQATVYLEMLCRRNIRYREMASELNLAMTASQIVTMLRADDKTGLYQSLFGTIQTEFRKYDRKP